jgi:aryl-alcohol dehydrogenase-like predicted oxidoreductase
MTRFEMSRRAWLSTAAAAGACSLLPAASQAQAIAPVQKRPIPVSGEMLPIIGTGTAVIYEFDNDPAKYAERKETLRTMVAGGASLIDTAPSYGKAEEHIGNLSSELGIRDKLFLATKYGGRGGTDRTTAEASLKDSQAKLKTQKIDLMQAWNVSDANFDLGLLREWKAQGHCRYIGITSSMDAAYDSLAQVLKREKPDFFQINYSLGDRDAEATLLPLAKDSGAAVLTNLPFGRNSLFQKVGGRPVPDWAKDIDCTSWAQIFLKFILSHPSVTAVIPGTDKPQYMLDNLAAGRGRMPEAAFRKKIADYWATLS